MKKAKTESPLLRRLRLCVVFKAGARCTGVGPELIDLSPEGAANGGDRASKQTGDLFPLVPGSSKHENASISRTELADDIFQLQPIINSRHPTFVSNATGDFVRVSDDMKPRRLGGIAAQGARESRQEKTVLTRGQGGTNTIQVARHLCHGVFHQFGCRGRFAHRRPRPMAGAFPDLMASQSHIGPNLSSCLVDIPIPPNKHFSCA